MFYKNSVIKKKVIFFSNFSDISFCLIFLVVVGFEYNVIDFERFYKDN